MESEGYLEHKYSDNNSERNPEQYKQSVSGFEQSQNKGVDVVKENNDIEQKEPTTTVNNFQESVVETNSTLDKETIKRINDIESRTYQTEHEVEQKIEEIESLKQKQAKISELEFQIDGFQTQNAKLKDDLAHRLKELERLRRENANLKMAETSRKTQENPENLSNAVDRLSVLIRGRDKEIERLNKIIDQSKKEKCNRPQDHEELKNRIKETDSQIKQLTDFKEKHDLLNTKYGQKVGSFRLTDKEFDSLVKSIEQSAKELEKILDNKLQNEDKLQREIQNLTKKLEEKHSEVDVVKQKFRIKTEELSQDIGSLNESIKTKERTISDLKKENEKIASENERLKKKLKNLNVVVEDKDSQISTLKEDLKKVNKELDNCTKSFRILENDRDQFIMERDSLLNMIDDMKRTTIQSQSKDEDQNFTNQLILEPKKTEISDDSCRGFDSLKTKLSYLRQLQNKATEENQELLPRTAELTVADIKQLSSLKHQFNHLIEELNELVKILEQKECELNNLGSFFLESKELKSRLEESDQKIERLNLIISTGEAYIKELEKSVARTKIISESYKDLYLENEKLIGENRLLRYQNEKLQNRTIYNQTNRVSENPREICDKNTDSDQGISNVKNAQIEEQKSPYEVPQRF